MLYILVDRCVLPPYVSDLSWTRYLRRDSREVEAAIVPLSHIPPDLFSVLHLRTGRKRCSYIRGAWRCHPHGDTRRGKGRRGREERYDVGHRDRRPGCRGCRGCRRHGWGVAEGRADRLISWRWRRRWKPWGARRETDCTEYVVRTCRSRCEQGG